METNLSYYGARYLDMKTSLWLNVDPLTEKMPNYGAYVFAFNNPVKFIDPDGQEPKDEFDENGKKIGILGGASIDYHHQKNGDVKVTDTKSKESQIIKGGSKLIKDYVKRKSDVDYKDITFEYTGGYGPENSLFEGNHPVNKEIASSPIFKEAINQYNKTDKESPYGARLSFGLLGAYKAGSNMTAQMLGKASISFYPIGDNVLVMVNDSKSHNSINPIAKAHAWTLATFSKEFGSSKDYSDFGNYDRRSKKFIEPLSTTRQTYLFVIPNSQLNKYK